MKDALFIDTGVFIADNFHVYSIKYKSVLSYVNRGELQVLSTDITEREIEANIEEEVAKARAALAASTSKARILKNLSPRFGLSALFADLDAKKLSKEVSKKVAGFFRAAKSVRLKATKQEPSVVFEKYFAREPPFGQGKKKAEFPDAFVLETLEEWSKKTGNVVHVLSTDPDMKSYCERSDRLLYVPTVEAFVDSVISRDESISSAVRRTLSGHTETIRDIIVNQEVMSDVILMDEDGEGTTSEVHNVAVGSISLVHLTKTKATVEFQVTIDLEIQTVYDDYDTASYDSEEDKYLVWDKKYKTIHRTVKAPVEMSFEFSATDESIFTLHQVEINNGEPHKIRIDEEDE